MALRLDLTAADLDDIPSDGRRWELLEGVLHVTPAPRVRHQLAVSKLLIRLAAAAPTDLMVLPAPTDYRPSGRTNVQPDLIVVPRSATDLLRIVERPELVVEILSPSTRGDDLGSKRLLFETLGVLYWVIDPDARTLTVFAPGEPPAEWSGMITLARPFALTIDLEDLG